MIEPCHWATMHWLRFAEIRTPDMLNLSDRPVGAQSWKIGPDGAVGPDGMRLPSDVWCAVGLYVDEAHAAAAVADPDGFLPFLGETTEAWHTLLKPIAHRGECNHLDRDTPGLIFPTQGEDDGGPLVVITSAGFNLGPQLDIARVIDFRRNVDRVRVAVAAAEGRVAHQVFTPHTLGDDGMTMTVWRNDGAMSAFAYRPGEHRERLERYKREQTCDRTSFTRLRPVRTSGSWEGRCPVAAARELAA